MSNSGSREESKTSFIAAFPEFVEYSYITLLLWIFGIAVFIPLSSLVRGPPNISSIVALIFFVPIAISGTRVFYAGKRALESYIDLAAQGKRRKWLKPNLIKFLGYIGIAILAGIIFAPIAWFVNPVFGGIAIALVVLVAAFFILPLVSDLLTSSKRNR